MQQYNIVSDYYFSFIKSSTIFRCNHWGCNIVSGHRYHGQRFGYHHHHHHHHHHHRHHQDPNLTKNQQHHHHHHHHWWCSSSYYKNKRQTETFTFSALTATFIASNNNNNNNQKFLIVTSLVLFILFQLFDSSLSTSFTAIKLKTETNNQIYRSRIDNTSYNAIINGEISLPCNITAPSFDDGVSLVLWYRDDIATPIYTVDARQSLSLEKAQHFLHTDLFEQRATFNLSYPLSFLHIKHVKPNDGGDYRCRVDFRRARTVNRILKLTVIVPTTNVIIYDQNFQIIDKIAGPFEEDSTQSLICDSNEGNPLPVVHWWRGSNLIDTEYFIVNNTISRNVLTLANLSRDDLQISLTCQAYNTNLTVPIVKTIILDLYLKPKEIRIITPLDNIQHHQQHQQYHSNGTSGANSMSTTTATTKNSFTAIELACQCSGSKPPAKIKWKKGSNSSANINSNQDEWLDAFSEIISNDGLTTTSFLSFVPSIDDNGKNVYCIGYNPKISEIYSIENSWPININYAPILSLVMGSNSLSQDIIEGSNVYFECDIKANPYVHTFGWKLNGQILDLSQSSSSSLLSKKMLTTSTMADGDDTDSSDSVGHHLSHVEMRNTSLLLTNVNHEHHGHYQCFASNKIGSSQSESVFLNVKYSPRCKQPNVIPVGVALEETVSIECQVLANPTNVQFEWRMENIINNKTFISNKSIQYTSVGLKSVAKYRSKSIEDYGYLYCQASNIVGRQDKPCVFHIIKAEAPSHPHNCSLVNKTAHSLTVECLPGYSGGLEQTFFLQVYSLDPNRLLKNLSNNQMPFFSIDDLPAGYIFKLVIYSSNRKGISKPIEITGSTTEPSPWKTADYGANDSMSATMTPFVLMIVLVVIILILLLSILVHIRNRIKGRMRTVVQASDSKHPPPTITTTTITNNHITPKSIMKKKQKNFDPQTGTETTILANNGLDVLVEEEDDDDGNQHSHINVNDINMIMANETIEINDLTTFKPDYLRNVAACIENNSNVNGSSTTTTTTTISPLPYTNLVPSTSTTEFLLNDENHLSLQTHTHHHTHLHQHLSPIASSHSSHSSNQLPQPYHHYHHRFTIPDSSNSNSNNTDTKMEISSIGSYELYGIPGPMEIIQHHHNHEQLQNNTNTLAPE